MEGGRERGREGASGAFFPTSPLGQWAHGRSRQRHSSEEQTGKHESATGDETTTVGTVPHRAEHLSASPKLVRPLR